MRVAKVNGCDLSYEIEIRPDDAKEIHLYFCFEWMTTEAKPRKMYKESAGSIYTMDAIELRDNLTKAIKAARKHRKPLEPAAPPATEEKK